MQEDITEIKSDVKEIKTKVGEILVSQAVHNQILEEHHKRSTNLEERIKPLEISFWGGLGVAFIIGLLSGLKQLGVF